jgi:hypothetical protein
MLAPALVTASLASMLLQPSAAGRTCTGNPVVADIVCTRATVLTPNASAVIGASGSECCVCPAGTVEAYRDQHMAFQFRIDGISRNGKNNTGFPDGSLQWVASTPVGLTLTMNLPADPLRTPNLNTDTSHFYEPGWGGQRYNLPPGVPPGLIFVSTILPLWPNFESQLSFCAWSVVLAKLLGCRTRQILTTKLCGQTRKSQLALRTRFLR